MKRICMLSRSHRSLKWAGNDTIVHTLSFSFRRVVLANHELSQFRRLAVLQQNSENPRPLQTHANFTEVGPCDKLRWEFWNKNHSSLKAPIERLYIRLAMRRVSGNCPDVRSLEPVSDSPDGLSQYSLITAARRAYWLKGLSGVIPRKRMVCLGACHSLETELQLEATAS